VRERERERERERWVGRNKGEWWKGVNSNICLIYYRTFIHATMYPHLYNNKENEIQ
jgi:hypothetical protein